MKEVQETPAPPETLPPSGSPGMLGWIKWWMLALTLLVIALWVVYAAHYAMSTTAREPPAEKPGPSSALPRTGKTGAARIAEGPWGRLEIVPITICPPLGLVEHRMPVRAREVVWYFPCKSRDGLAGLLRRVGLPEPLQSTLLSLARPIGGQTEGYTVRPGPELLMGLDGQTRARLYLLLHDWTKNTAQSSAFHFQGTSARQWFEESLISRKTLDLVTPMLYRHGSFLLFADAATVSPLLSSPGERRRLLGALSRESTLLLRLRLSRDSDIDALARYWGRGERVKDIRPILQSFSHLDGEQGLDVTHLLPPFARRRVYTYSDRPDKNTTVYHDCHWTALNFYSERPDDRFGDVDATYNTFYEDYVRASEPLQFGDLAAYVSPEGKMIHTAVYIAADVVFTKNGIHASPWIFLTLDAMKDYYPRSRPLVAQFFRRKDQ